MRSRLPLVLVTLVIAIFVFIAIGQAGRKPEQWQLTDVEGHLPDLAFALTDDRGKPVTAQDYRGKIALLYFGYTHCPGVCPITLGRMKSVFRALGRDANDMRLLFVSVDPMQDTPQSLLDYLKAFDPAHMTGLTGKPSIIEGMARQYRAAYQPASAGNDIMHSDAIYIFDKDGHARLLATSSDKDEALTSDLKRLAHDGK